MPETEGRPVTPVDRELPTREAYDLLDMVRSVAADRLRPLAAAAEQAGDFPRGLLRELGGWGLLGLPYESAYGGGAQPYVVYLQVVEEIAAAWLTIAETISVHTLASYPLAAFGLTAQKDRWLESMLSGDLLGAYCLSEPGSGSDAASLSTRATQDGDDYVVDGTKAWITHAGHADVYNLMVRTGKSGSDGISCLFADAATPGLKAGRPERKMGLRASPVAQLHLTGARVPKDRLIGGEGQGFRIALAALDSGRLGIAACAVGLAQAALDCASTYAGERRQFGRPIQEFQGVGFMLADMATAIEAGRHLYVAAARRRDAGQPFGMQAAMAKLFCTDMAMKVTIDAVQVLGGVDYTEDFPAERYMREAKGLQIFEGTNQIQRLVISRHLASR
jgi:alkylation response protein AidB-like acyl-CoA dehydrogenase